MSTLIRELLTAGAPLEDVERLIAQWGGLPLYVPATITDEHPIVRIAGSRVAKALCRLYAGEKPIIPLGAVLRRERARQQIQDLRQAGMNHVEIARRLGLHLRQVQRLAGTAAPSSAAGGEASIQNEFPL